MLQQITKLTFVLIVLCVASNAHAQFHHIPSIAGRYENGSPEICTLTQQGGQISLSCVNPGVTTFTLNANNSLFEFMEENNWVKTISGFHGTYQLTYADGRPGLTGTAGLYPRTSTGELELRFYIVENGMHKQVSSVVLYPSRSNHTAPVYNAPATTPVPGKLSAAPDKFNLLPTSELKDLGF